METPKWRKAKIKFLTEQHHNLIDYGNSTRGCDTIHPGDIRDVVFEFWDDDFEHCAKKPRFAHIQMYDVVLMTDEDFEIIELSLPQEQHPSEICSEMRREEEMRREHKTRERMFSRSLTEM